MQGLHYLDDFLFIDQVGTSHNNSQLRIALCTCQLLGVPTAPDKVHEPSNVLTFLGIEIDSTSLQLHLPEPKLTELCQTLAQKNSCTKRELLSLVGKLHHASAVVKPGRTFLRRLIDLSTTVTKLHHHIRLTNSARSDIQRWHSFLAIWNGISYLPPAEPHYFIESDAPGSWGGAAIWGCQWFQFRWPDSWQNINIAVKELLPIVMTITIWSKVWSGQSVRCWCDNEAVVTVVNTG